MWVNRDQAYPARALRGGEAALAPAFETLELQDFAQPFVY